MKALLLCAALLATSLSAAPVQWRPLQTGVELAQIAPGPLYVVRIDPARAKIRAGLLSEKGGKSKTAGEWCRSERFAVAINAGMFQTGKGRLLFLFSRTPHSMRDFNDIYAGLYPTVKAWAGALPNGIVGFEFFTDVEPDPGSPPGWRNGVKDRRVYA